MSSADYGPAVLAITMPTHKVALKGEQAVAFLTRAVEAGAAEGEEEQRAAAIERVDLPEVDAFYLDGVLSEAECQSICQAMDECPDISFWSCLGRDNEDARLFRDADTIEVQHTSFAAILWQRIAPHLRLGPIDMPDTEPDDDPRWERELPGRWLPDSVNEDLLFVRYPSGGAFAPHSDGHCVAHFNRRSFYSIVLFLNAIPEGAGGGTSFYTPDAVKKLTPAAKSGRWTADASLVLATVQPRPGRMLVFEQCLVHEGVPPVAPHGKYIIRSDVMYRRDPPVCDQPHDLEAYALFRQAETLSEEGRADEAVKMFQRAFKLSPTLAQMMGN